MFTWIKNKFDELRLFWDYTSEGQFGNEEGLIKMEINISESDVRKAILEFAQKRTNGKVKFKHLNFRHLGGPADDTEVTAVVSVVEPRSKKKSS